MTHTIVMIPRHQIDPSELRIREPKTDDVRFEALKENIAELGINVPLVVRPRKGEDGSPIPDRYELIEGLQRYTIAGHDHLDIEDLPCFVRDVDDDTAQILQFGLNEFRIPNSPVEKANLFKTVLNRHPEMSQKDLARMAGVSDATLSQILKLNRLCPEAKALVEKGKLGASKAVALANVPPENQPDMFEHIDQDAGQFISRSIAYARECKKAIAPKKAIDLVVPTPKSKAELTDMLNIARADVGAADPDNADYLRLVGRKEMIEEVLKVDPESLDAKKESKEIATKRREIEKLEKQLKARKEMEAELAKQKESLATLV